jgi:hypothetical protein
MIDVLRAEDLLFLLFEFVNLDLDTSGVEARLVRLQAGEPAFIVVHFSPQHVW